MVVIKTHHYVVLRNYHEDSSSFSLGQCNKYLSYYSCLIQGEEEDTGASMGSSQFSRGAEAPHMAAIRGLEKEGEVWMACLMGGFLLFAATVCAAAAAAVVVVVVVVVVDDVFNVPKQAGGSMALLLFFFWPSNWISCACI